MCLSVNVACLYCKLNYIVNIKRCTLIGNIAHRLVFWRYLTRGLILHLCHSSIRPSIYLSCERTLESVPGTNQYYAIRVTFLA